MNLTPPAAFAPDSPDALERLTVRRYLAGQAAQGFWYTGMILFPFVLAKSLDAPAWQVTLAVVMETTGMMLALYWGQLMQHGGRRRGLFWSGLLGRVVTVAALAVHTSTQMLWLLGIVYFFTALVYPAQNGILQENIHPSRQGKVFGRGALVQHLTAAGLSLVVGWVLNRNPDYFRYVYPVLGIVGFLYPLILAGLPRPQDDATHDPPRYFTVPRLPLGAVKWRRLPRAIIQPFAEAVRTFRDDRNFAWFEGNFMIYGIAYMMLIPVVPLFFANELHLSYQEISSSRVLIGSLGVALLGPLAGQLQDRFHAVGLSTLSFSIVALYPAALAAGAWLNGAAHPALVAYAAFGIYSIGMAGIMVTWNIGSLAFAPKGQGGYYQGIHVTMVGIRGVLGPAIGFVVLETLGYREVFLLAVAIFVTAAISSAFLRRRIVT